MKEEYKTIATLSLGNTLAASVSCLIDFHPEPR
jgi:hypothetical protein